MTKACNAGCGLSNFGLSSCEGQHALLWYPCLPAQVPFRLEAVLSHLEKILEERGHVVVCIAEGAGQVRAGPRTCTWGQSTWCLAEIHSGQRHTRVPACAQLGSRWLGTLHSW